MQFSTINHEIEEVCKRLNHLVLTRDPLSPCFWGTPTPFIYLSPPLREKNGRYPSDIHLSSLTMSPMSFKALSAPSLILTLMSSLLRSRKGRIIGYFIIAKYTNKSRQAIFIFQRTQRNRRCLANNHKEALD